MAAEPSKTEIQTVFKRLRAIPTNKVLEREAHGSCRPAEKTSLVLWGPREGGDGGGRLSCGFERWASTLGPNHLLVSSST